MNGPFEIELKIRLTDGKKTAVVTYDMPSGKCPSKKEIQEALADSVAKAREQIGADWRLQNRHEFTNEIMSERYGGMTPEFATAENWDK